MIDQITKTENITVNKPIDPYAKFSTNALEVMDALNSLTKSLVYINNPEKYGSMDEITANEKVVNFIDTATISAYIQYMRDLEGRTFVPYIDTTFEFSVYIERTCTKLVNTSVFSSNNFEKGRQPYAQHIILDVLKIPDYFHNDRRTIEIEYRGAFNNHPFKKALSLGLQKQGIIYLAEFDAKIITNKIITLLQDNWVPEYKNDRT